jgi:uncharacterized membrane protein
MDQPPADDSKAATTPHPGWSDERVEQVVGNLLRVGVTLSAVVVAVGGILYLARHGREPLRESRIYSPQRVQVRRVFDMFSDAWELHSGGVIELGLLLLIGTPITRVLFSVIAFVFQRDYVYVGVTLVVLTVLLYSLFSGYLH